MERVPGWQRLVSRHPIPTEEQRAEAAKGLPAAAAAYAKQAAYNGSKDAWWRVWRAIERARGHRLPASLDTLRPEGRRWFFLRAESYFTVGTEIERLDKIGTSPLIGCRTAASPRTSSPTGNPSWRMPRTDPAATASTSSTSPRRRCRRSDS